MISPDQSRKFVRVLIAFAVVWCGLGVGFHYQDPVALMAFVQVFLFSFLDVIFLILLFWNLFFVPPTQRTRQFQIMTFGFFKLVCLGFLAMILKRFREAPSSSLLMGVAFIGLGPMVAGIFSRSKEKT